MKFCGIDLHSTNSVVVVTNETDEVLVHRRCPNDLPTILAVLEPHRPELAGVVVESTYNLVLARRWPASCRVYGETGQHGGHAALRRAQAQRRRG